MIEVGKLLKEKREELGFSLEEMAEKTKIHLHQLEAIEKGQKNQLPAKVFAMGLIKSYARELKVEKKQIDEMCAQAFQDDIEIQEIEPPQVTEEEIEEKQTVGLFQVSRGLSLLFSLLLVSGLIVAIFLIFEKMNSYSQEEKIPEDLLSEAPLTEIPKPSKPEKEKSVKPEQDETKEKPTNDSRVSQDQKIKTPPAAESEPEKKVQVVTAPSPSETAPSTIEPKEDGSESTTPTTTLYSDNKLIIRALEPVTAEITWADGYIQKILMKEQESKTLVFTSPIQVRLSNGGVVNINFNQKDQGVPGPLNQPIELKFP